jgi:hypothetical protein
MNIQDSLRGGEKKEKKTATTNFLEIALLHVVSSQKEFGPPT